jgi:hypothetical protein
LFKSVAKEVYEVFLRGGSIRYSSLTSSEANLSELSHDNIKKLLREENCSPQKVWQEAEYLIDKGEDCLLIVKDLALSKKFNKKIDLLNYQYSENEYDLIPGIGVIDLLWYGWEQNQPILIDSRIYDKKTDGKTKNNHFCEMLELAKKRGLNPTAVVMDEWYSSLKNLNKIANLGWIWVAGLQKNRKINSVSVETLKIPNKGLKVHLRNYGWVTVFQLVGENGRIDYIATNMENPS